MGDSWGIQREVMLNDLTSSWAQIDANWKRPSPSVFLQIYSSGIHDKSSRKDVGRRSLTPVLQNMERGTTESGGVDLDPSWDDLLQGAMQHVVSSSDPRREREVITLDDGDDNDDEVGQRSGMTTVTRPEFMLSSQDDFMMADILKHTTRDDGVLFVGSVPPPSQNEDSAEQTHHDTHSTTQGMTVVEHVEPKSTTSDREIPIDPPSHPMDTEPNSIFDFSHDNVPSSQTVQSVQETTSPFSSPNLLPEPSNDSTIPVNDIQVNHTEPPSEPDTNITLIPSQNPPPPPDNPATLISHPTTSLPTAISRPSSSGYDSHTMFLAQVLAREQTKQEQQQAKTQRKERRDKARARAAARNLMVGNVDSDEAPKGEVSSGRGTEAGVEVVSSNLETVEHEGQASENTLPMEIERTVTHTELPFKQTEGQGMSSLDHPTQPTSSSPASRSPSPAIDMDTTPTKEVTLSEPEAPSEPIIQHESPPPTGDEILLDAQVLESSTVTETETHMDIVQHDPDSVMDEDESIPTENMHGVVETDGVERTEVEESTLVPRVEMDTDMSPEDTELVRQRELVPSDMPTNENLLDAHQVEDQFGEVEEITRGEENVKDGNELQTSLFDSTQSTSSPTSEIPETISTTYDSRQTLPEQDTTSFRQSHNTQHTNPEPLIQTPHLVLTTIPSDDPPVTESHPQQQSVSPSIPPGLPESVKRMWHAPIPPLPSPRVSYAVFQQESVSVDMVEMRRKSATPVLTSAPIPPPPSPRLPRAVVEEHPVSVDTVKTNRQSTSPRLTSPVSPSQSPLPSEAASPLDKEPSPTPLVSPVSDAQTQTTPLIPSISPPSAPKATDQPPPPKPLRKRSVSIVIPVPPRSQTTTPLPTISPSTSPDSTPPSPSRAVKFKVRFNEPPSPPSKRRKVSRSKSQDVQPPSAPPAGEREMQDCITVRNDFENAPKHGLKMEDV